MSPLPLPAAAVVLVRRPRRGASKTTELRAPGGDPRGPATEVEAGPPVEAFLVERAEDQPFLGGFACFPGGRCDPGDAAVPVIGAAGPAAATLVTACRELFEEAGVLLGRGVDAVAAADLTAARVDVLGRRVGFGAALTRLGVELDADLLRPAGRWVTPAYVPLRFDTQYFLAELPPGQEATVIVGELQAGAWSSVAAARARFGAATLLLPPPVRYALDALAAGDAGAAARLVAAPARHAAAEQARIFDLADGIVLLALKTPTLPPAYGTNCYVIGVDEAVIVDPGTPYAAEQAVLDEALALLAARGTRPREVILTHHHPDHVGAAAHLRARHGLPVAAHAATAARLGEVVAVDRILADDELIALPGAPPRRLRVIATPGHAPGHVALLEEETGALVGGDLCATLGYIVIDPADGGDMSAYLASLRRARVLGARLLLPAHGLPSRRVAARLDDYVAHRLAREALVLAALRAQAGAVAAAALLPLAYADTPAALWPLAARSLEAHLLKLEREGAVARTAGAWRAA